MSQTNLSHCIGHQMNITHTSRQQGQTTTPYAWDTLETESNIKQFKGQYIRIQIPEMRSSNSSTS